MSRVDVSLLYGWVPWLVGVVALSSVAGATGWRERRWRRRTVPLLAAGTGVLTVAVAAGVTAHLGLPDPLPVDLWLWIGVLFFAVGVAVAGWRGARWWRRGVSVLAVVLVALAGAVSVNTWIGYYPTLGTALADLTGRPVPGEIGQDQLAGVPADTATGRVVSVDIPATHSHFRHRTELVYLPPAWFRTGGTVRLPVLELIGGEFATPANWIRAGGAVATADAFAARHGGYAPILVFVDASGDFRVDSECVNGDWGNAEDHLVRDVPAFVVEHFNAASTARGWGVVGWSMGGTCAIHLVVRHPEVFGHFADISGDLGPNLGGREKTIRTLYHGDSAAWAEHDPLTVLDHRRDYQGVSGWFADGADEPFHLIQATRLKDAADRAGIHTHLQVSPGEHNWMFGATAFADALPWLADQLDLTPQPTPVAGRP